MSSISPRSAQRFGRDPRAGNSDICDPGGWRGWQTGEGEGGNPCLGIAVGCVLSLPIWLGLAIVRTFCDSWQDGVPSCCRACHAGHARRRAVEPPMALRALSIDNCARDPAIHAMAQRLEREADQVAVVEQRDPAAISVGPEHARPSGRLRSTVANRPAFVIVSGRTAWGARMRDDQIFGVIASVALLVWLLGRGMASDPRRRRQVEIAAFGLIAAGILYALVRTVAWFAG